jgi:hypothetical protein
MKCGLQAGERLDLICGCGHVGFAHHPIRTKPCPAMVPLTNWPHSNCRTCHGTGHVLDAAPPISSNGNLMTCYTTTLTAGASTRSATANFSRDSDRTQRSAAQQSASQGLKRRLRRQEIQAAQREEAAA